MATGPGRSVAAYLGLRRSVVGLLLAVVLLGLGERLSERFLPIYLLALGGGELAIGFFNGLSNLQSALYSLYGGWLSDRVGFRRALILSNLLTIAGYTLVILFPSWPVVLAGSVLFLSWSAISMPATMGLVRAALPADQQTMGVSMHSLVRRLPMALGPLMGGVLIDALGETTGVRVAFAAALLVAIVALFVQQRLIAAPPPRAAAAADPRRRPLRILRALPPELKNLLVSDILIRFCEQIPYAFVVVWCIKTIAAPVTATQFGVLTAVEMTTALVVYIPVAHFADRGDKRGFVLATFAFFTLFPLVLLVSQSFWPLVLAFVVRGLKEFGEATRKALIVELAPRGREELTFGAYYFVRDAVVTLAALGGAALWMISPTLNLLAAAACGLAGTIGFGLGRRSRSGR